MQHNSYSPILKATNDLHHRARTNLAPIRQKVHVGLRCTVLFDHNADSVITDGSIKGNEYEQTQAVRAKFEEGSVEISLIAVDDGGNQTRVKRASSLAK